MHKGRILAHNAGNKEIGNRIRAMRIQAHLSQEKLGEKLGVSFQQIQKYENGHNAVHPVRLKALCEALNCSVENLLGLEESMVKVPTLSSAALRMAMRIDKLTPQQRIAVTRTIDAFEETQPND